MPTEPQLPRGLYGIADSSFGQPVALAMLLAESGCRVIQLRAKDWTTARRADCARTLVERLGDQVCVVVNDDVEAAAWSGAGGVHLGQEDGRLRAARLRLGPGALIGRSTHGLGDVARLEPDADYIGFGPVFPTSTKAAAGDARGIQLLSEVVRRASVPVVAIGGISLDNIAAVRATGVHSWAVISDIFRHPQPALRARQLHI